VEQTWSRLTNDGADDASVSNVEAKFDELHNFLRGRFGVHIEADLLPARREAVFQCKQALVAMHGARFANTLAELKGEL
jgi:hypothetical protein